MAQRRRNLKIELQGDDVKLLHEKLAMLDFTIPGKERTKGMY